MSSFTVCKDRNADGGVFSTISSWQACTVYAMISEDTVYSVKCKSIKIHFQQTVVMFVAARWYVGKFAATALSTGTLKRMKLKIIQVIQTGCAVEILRAVHFRCSSISIILMKTFFIYHITNTLPINTRILQKVTSNHTVVMMSMLCVERRYSLLAWVCK